MRRRRQFRRSSASYSSTCCGQQVLEVGLAHRQQRGGAVRIGVVRARQAVEQRDVAEPGARLHVGERHLLARHRHRADAHRALGHAAPVLGRRTARRERRAIRQPAHHGARQDRGAQLFGEGGEPWARVDVVLFVDCKNRVVHSLSLRRQPRADGAGALQCSNCRPKPEGSPGNVARAKVLGEQLLHRRPALAFVQPLRGREVGAAHDDVAGADVQHVDAGRATAPGGPGRCGRR